MTCLLFDPYLKVLFNVNFCWSCTCFSFLLFFSGGGMRIKMRDGDGKSMQVRSFILFSLNKMGREEGKKSAPMPIPCPQDSSKMENSVSIFPILLTIVIHVL